MLGCIYQLWDWLEAPPLFNAATMDAKKLQQLQQAQHLQKKIPLAYQTNIADYRTATHSPVFQQQQHGNYHMGHVAAAHQQQYQQSPTTTSSSGPLTPIDIQPHASKLLLKHQLHSSGSGGSSAHSSPYHQASTSSGYPTSSTGGTGGTDQLYQSPTERTYLTASGRINSGHNQASSLQLQYQQLQQAKLQAQLATQNEAAQNQQRQFALRQMINPPVPQGHYHMSQSSSMMSTLTQQQQQQQQQQQPTQTHQQQQQQQRAPPSSLNLTNQFQPAAGPLKVTQQNAHKAAQHYHQQQQQQQQQEQIYGQHQHQQLQMQLHHQKQLQQHHHALQQRSKSDLQTPQSNDQSPIYIQQNHPGHVVNQAVQTQISTVAKTSSNPPQMTKTPSSEESSSVSARSPSHAPLDRKKSGGGSITNSQALKSPVTKRPPNSPITISGWLYKQGSDGLKVWRKRWFVLAEYCLYYYKGPEEDKVLGSILLPSYKVSACLPEDKIYRKYAFKCEHQNMRTYWLAAENAESMIQWVRALSGATMMQAPSSAGESSEHPSGSSSLNHSGENSDSGIHTLQSQQSKMSGQGQVTPASDNGGVTTSSSSGQPLYANAPPKPRRITDGGYSSPSPEHSIDNEAMRQHQMHHQQQLQQSSRRSGIMSPTLQQMQQYQQQSRSQHHAIYDARTGNVSSAMRIPQQQQSNYPIDTLESQYQQELTLSPDDYPQSPSAQYMDAQMEQQIMQLQQQRVAVDDIYGERELYMQRLIQQRYPPHMAAYVSAAERRTPDAYGRSKNRIFSDYEDIYNLTAGAGNTSAQEALLQEAASYRRPLSPPSYEGNKHVPSAMTARYTPNNLESSGGHNAASSNMNIRARPAAGIVRPHSADFLEYEARAEAAADAAALAATVSMIKPDPVRAPRPKSSLDINRTPDSFYYSEENYAEKMRKSALYLQNPQAQPQQAGTYRTTSGSTDFLSPVASGPTSTPAGGAGGLTQSTPTSHLDGERKREESMKRLLEWKQRMLQSPLTRKSGQHSAASATQSGQTIAGQSNMSAMSKLGSNPNILLASAAVASGLQYPITKGAISSATSSTGGIQRSRSETHANTGPTAGYNSYSSDDEASISVRNVRNLPKGNLTVKPDPSDPQLQQQRQLQQQYNYEQMQKLENSYYGTAHDMKYAKTTLLTDRNTVAGGNATMNEPYATSTPLHRPSNSGGVAGGVAAQDCYGTSGNIYEMHNTYQQQLLQQQQQQQLMAHPMRRVGSRAEIDMLERETSSQIRNRLRTAEGLTRAESIQRLDYLKQHLLDLERQYEKSKPLVNLVDNMVKLGSLYRNDANGRTQRPEAVTLDRLEFNQRIQEKRLLQEEQKQWDRLNPDHSELQSKVRQLYHLDQLLQEESGTLQNLQRDKEDLERALGSLKARIQDTSGPPLALEAAKKQQIMLERELSRVHQLLAENSKKLEQTVAGNARLEQELLVLRQKLQATRGSQSALQVSDTYTSNTTAMLESELKRVQTLVGDMQRQRQELSSAVKQLTENSNRLYQEIGNKEHGSLRNCETSSNNGSIKKRTNSGCWIETDLDTMMCVNRTLSDSTMNLSTPLYVDTSSNNTSGNLLNCSSTSSKLSDYNTGDSMTNETQRRMASSSYRYNDSSDNLETSGVDSDGFLETNPFANLTQQEKQEIKTVRIVKRESERRHRDRSERSGLSNSTQNLDQVAEEEQYNLMNGGRVVGMGGNYHAKEYQTTERSKSLPRTHSEPPKSSSRHHHRHKHGSSSHHNSASTSLSSTAPSYNDYYGHNGASNAYDKNSNYSSSSHHQQQQQQTSQHNHQHQLTNGHGKSQPREHLNPLANAYFAKQMQQQKHHNSHSHHNHSSHSRHSSQSALRQKTDSVQSLNKSLSDLTPSFQSEAARQIMNEMSAGSASEDTEKVQDKVPSQHKHRRAVPKEKRRHYTAPNNVVPVKTIENGLTENDMNRNNTNWRARDDLDMEVALRPRMNAPDVVRSALRNGDKISENTIDNLLLAPNKIVIPERYIPETTPELSPEEKKRRQEKVESIKKMLSEAPISTANETTATLPPSKINEEKKQREHLLQLNQILAQQVMQMSKIVAEKAMSRVGNGDDNDDDYDDEDDYGISPNGDEDDNERKSESPSQPLPIHQQRNNYYS